jgi:hypothetical protein
MTGARSISSCKPILKALKLLTVQSHYILSLMTFMAHNLGHFTFNVSMHGTNKREKLDSQTKSKSYNISERCVLCVHGYF